MMPKGGAFAKAKGVSGGNRTDGVPCRKLLPKPLFLSFLCREHPLKGFWRNLLHSYPSSF
jgi:hypothetical protein